MNEGINEDIASAWVGQGAGHLAILHALSRGIEYFRITNVSRSPSFQSKGRKTKSGTKELAIKNKTTFQIPRETLQSRRSDYVDSFFDNYTALPSSL